MMRMPGRGRVMRSVELGEFFDDMPAANIEVDSGRSRLVSVLSSVVAFILIVTVVPTALAVPVAVTIKTAADEAVRAYDAVPAELPNVPTALPGFTRVFDADGGVIAQFYAENRTPVDFDEVSPLLVDAIVAVEDRRFWDHHGVDGEGIIRAARANMSEGSTVQGASTLTQQLVENLKLLDADTDEEREAAKAKTLDGKLIEAKTALELEEQMSKREILTTYMNVVYFGSGSYGVAAAAQRFFGVDVADLSLSQAALIAGMVRSPSGLDPFLYPERATNRRDTVLAAMSDTGYISDEEARAAMEEPLDTSNGKRPANGCSVSPYPFYCAIVRDQLLADPRLGRTQAQRDAAFFLGHLDVHTALEPEVMNAVDASIDEAFADGNRVATSVVVIEPGTGLVLGVGQNRQWGSGEGETEIPYAVSAFQPGSTFKATVLASALKQGVSPRSTMLANSGFQPAGFDYPDGGFDNSGGVNLGTIDAYTAARYSSNAWFTRLITRTGVLPAVETARDMGVRESLEGVSISSRSAAFALGAWEVTPVEMASVYATIAAAGSSCEPVFITDVYDTMNDTSLTTQRSECATVYDSDVSDSLVDVMQQPFTAGGTAADFPLSGGHEAVGKTGTTNNHAAAWFVGATPQYATAVWIGDPRGGQAYPLYDVEAYGRTYDRVFGADISGPLWNSVMERILADRPVVPFSRVTQTPVVAQALTDLVAAPDVRGMRVAEAVEMLDDAGYHVALDSGTASDARPGFVHSSHFEDGFITLTAGAGTARDLLGQEIAMVDGALAVVEQESQ